MSKIVAAVVAGSGATVASVGGVYWIYYSGNAPTLSFTDLNTFKNATVADVECVKDFNGLTDLKGEGDSVQTITNNSNKVESSFINTSDNTNVSKGCLIVNWDRKEYSDNKWNGDFKLLGTFEKGNNGFIAFLVAKEKEAKKLDLTGIFYALTKTNETGSITKKKEVSTGKEVDKTSSTPENNFPKVGTVITDLKNNPGWKMFTDKEELDNICIENGNTCKTPVTTKTLRGYWTGKGASDGKQQLDGGTGNLGEGGNNLYVTDEIKIPDIAKAEKGNGTRVACYWRI